MNLRSRIISLLLTLAVLPTGPLAAAQTDKHHGAPPPVVRPAPRPRPGPIAHPPRHFDRHWHDGYWHHGWYANRFGWWWVVGPTWYFYDVPVYPYRYVRPPDDVIVIERPTPSGPPPTAYWYWCNEPRGYYPYVPQCPGGWMPVAATPPATPKP